MTHVLITGGAGYIGSILTDAFLQAGYEVTVCDNLLYRQRSLLHLCANPRFHFVFGDVRDEAVMRHCLKNVDICIPLAAIVGEPACKRDPWLANTVNCDAMRLLLKLRSPAQLLIYPTTNSGYGTKSGDVFCTEETPLEPISLYGELKVRAERECLENENTITLRLATVFGMSPRMRLDLLVNHFVYTAVTAGYIVLYQKEFKRNYVHVRDVADCFLHCVNHAKQMIGRPYNVGLDEANCSKEELAKKIQEYVPQFYIHSAPVGVDPDQRNYVVSNQRLRKAGFVAQRSLDEGIKELIQGYKMWQRMEDGNV